MGVLASTIHRVLVAAVQKQAFRREEGQTFVEYALILAVIATAMTAVLIVFRGKLTTIYSSISADVGDALP